MSQPKCKCHPESPFLWEQQQVPSLAAFDKTMQVTGENQLSIGQKATLCVEEQRDKGVGVFLMETSKKRQKELREQALVKLKDFNVYTKAGRDRVKAKGK